MDSLEDILHQRAGKLDLGRQDELALIQKELDRLFHGKAKAEKLDHQSHTLTIAVTDSATASVVRLSQIQIISAIKGLTREPIDRLRIRLK